MRNYDKKFLERSIIFSAVFLQHYLVISQENVDGLLPLGKHNPGLGPIVILKYEPTPEEFYRNFVRESRPLLIRTKNPSWQKYFRNWNDLEFLERNFGEVSGKVYKRSVWTKGWPSEVRMKFGDFLKQASVNKNLYWDSLFHFDSPLLKHIPLPFHLRHSKFSEWVTSPLLLFTYNNASSVFHHDAAENFFFQISGKKTWLIANHSSTYLTYANEYDVTPGLSPIEPDKVNLTKYPLISDIKFYEITVEPGDFLYIPEYWWHQVRSFGSPTVAIGLWAEVFNFPDLELEPDIVKYTRKFAKLRHNEPSSVSCQWQQVTLHDVKRSDFKNPFTINSRFFKKENFLYFGSDADSFYCVNSNDGSVVWKYSVEVDVGSTPVVSKDRLHVFFADENNKVYSFSTLQNSTVWTSNINGGIVSSLRLSEEENVLIAASLDQHVYAMNSKTGEQVWQAGPFGGEIWSSPVLLRHKVLISVQVIETGKPSVILLDLKNGAPVWKYVTDTPIFATPAVDFTKNLAYVVDLVGNIHVINLVSGERLKIFETGDECYSSPVINEKYNRLYVVTSGGTIICFDSNSFSVVWQTNFFIENETSVMSSPLISSSKNILYQAVGANLYALDADTGDVAWKYSANEEYISSPRMDRNGIIYVGSVDQNLYAIDGSDGELIWSLKTDGPIISSVAMANNFSSREIMGGLL